MSLDIPTVTLTANAGYVSVAVSGGGAAATKYKITRSLAGVESLTLTKTLALSSTFTDYTPAAGLSYAYSAAAIDSSDNESQPSAAQNATITINNSYLFQVTKAAGTNKTGTLLELMNQEGQTRAYKREGDTLALAVGGIPQIKTSPITRRLLEIPLIVRNQDKAATMATLISMIESNACFCFRDSYGEKVFVTLPGQQIRMNFTHTMTLNLWGTSYSENVA